MIVENTKIIDKARSVLSDFSPSEYSEESKEILTSGLDYLDEAYNSTTAEKEKSLVINISNNYADIIVDFVLKEFSKGKQPPESKINYMLSLLNVFSKFEVDVKYDFDRVYSDILNMTFSSLLHGKIPDSDLSNVQDYLHNLKFGDKGKNVT